MRWIRRLLRRRPKTAPPRPDTPGQKAAEKALSRSRDARQEIQSQWAEVTDRSARLASERERNHFAEMFRAALEGGRH
jgi:flavin-binding protein dodecin